MEGGRAWESLSLFAKGKNEGKEAGIGSVGGRLHHANMDRWMLRGRPRGKQGKFKTKSLFRESHPRPPVVG